MCVQRSCALLEVMWEVCMSMMEMLRVVLRCPFRIAFLLGDGSVRTGMSGHGRSSEGYMLSSRRVSSDLHDTMHLSILRWDSDRILTFPTTSEHLPLQTCALSCAFRCSPYY